MLPLSAAVILGVRKPLEIELTSSIAEPSGAEPVALIPTLCEKAVAEIKQNCK